MKKDVLNRENDISLILNIIEKYSETKEYVSFGLDGEQGVGKTFVVEQICKKLMETRIKNEGKYFVVNYNCWENDFYYEPLNSILISISNTIEESKNKFNETFKGVLEEVAKDLARLLFDGLLSINPTVKELVKYYMDVNSRIEAKNQDIDLIDDNINLKKMLNKIKENIKKISDKKTIVIIIDELDRCLPEYQIKVLERLHHVFDSIDNVVLINVFDKKLIKNTIFNIFGNNISIDRYLDKFISFSLNINRGQYQEIILDQYPDIFSAKLMTERDKLFINSLMSSSKLNIRTIEKVLSNIRLINEVLDINFTNCNYASFLEFELIVILLRISIRSIKNELKNKNKSIKAASEVDTIRRVFGIDAVNQGLKYNENYIDTLMEFFYKIIEFSDEKKIANTLFDEKNNNIFSCKVLLSLKYNLGLYNGAVGLENNALDICTSVMNYIDMLYPNGEAV